jgi:hypothetical protein
MISAGPSGGWRINWPPSVGRFPILVGNMSGDRRLPRFDFLEAVVQPLEPLVDGFAPGCLALSHHMRLELAPRYPDRAAEEIIDQLQIDLAAMDQHTQAFPGGCHGVDQMKFISRKFFDFLFGKTLRHLVDNIQRPCECRRLKGMEQFHGGFPMLVTPILPDPDHGESDGNDHGNRLYGLEYDFS